MGKQIIIAIGREFGSAGHEIAERVAKDLNLAIYDRKLLDDLAVKHGMDPTVLERYDERAKPMFLTRTVKGHTNSLSVAVAELQFKYMQEKAESGESFVVVGRCAETVLAKYDGLISIFVLGDKETKLNRVMEKYELNKDQALAKMNRHDKKRKAYHNAYSKYPWGDSREYDMCINSSKLGIDGTVHMIEAYVKERCK